MFVWGENRRLTGRLIEAAAMMNEWDELSEGQELDFAQSRHLAWIANLNPQQPRGIGLLREGLRGYYGPQTNMRGIARWGFKEVREGAESARALLKAFPAGRIIFLERHLAGVLASNVASGWYEETGGLERVSSMWLANMRSFADLIDPRVLHLKYEDLIADPDGITRVLARHVGVAPARFEKSLFDTKVTGWGGRPTLGAPEHALLREPVFVEALESSGYPACPAGG